MLVAHLTDTPDVPDRDVLLAHVGEGVAVTFGGPPPDAGGVHVLVAGRPSAADLDALPRLRALVIPFAGVPPETLALLRDRPGLAAFNLHHNAPAAAEMAVALLLAAAKAVLPMDHALRAGRWTGRGRENPAVLLDGATALVLGFGAIGRRVAAACRALGMTVLATRRRADRVAVEDGVAVHPAGHLPALLPLARALIVCLPLTEATRGLIGARELALLPRTAVLVNVARGPVVDEDALHDALRAGRLHSAGIDAWYRYPGRTGDPADTMPSSRPFHELENVVLSPHRGGWLPGIEARRMAALGDVLRALAEGREVPGRVDLEAGY